VGGFGRRWSRLVAVDPLCARVGDPLDLETLNHLPTQDTRYGHPVETVLSMSPYDNVAVDTVHPRRELVGLDTLAHTLATK
jgi:hypothetical protein